MRQSLKIRLSEGPEDLLRIQAEDTSWDEPATPRYLRRFSADSAPGVIRWPDNGEEPVAMLGDLKVYVRPYADRIEVVLVKESPQARRAA